MLDDKFDQIINFSSDVIGALPKPEGLPSPYPGIRNRETGLGNTVCDATLEALKINVCTTLRLPNIENNTSNNVVAHCRLTSGRGRDGVL